MVAGFYSAIILINVFGQMIGTVFTVLFEGQKDEVGIIGTLCFIFILGTVVMMSINKIFGLITWLPDHVTNWIGQQLHSLGEDGDVSAAKGSFTGGAGSASMNHDGKAAKSVGDTAKAVGGAVKNKFSKNKNVPNVTEDSFKL